MMTMTMKKGHTGSKKYIVVLVVDDGIIIIPLCLKIYDVFQHREREKRDYSFFNEEQTKERE